MASKTKIGEFLKSKGDTQKDAANVIGVSETSFSYKANGRSDFKQSEIKKFSAHYGMTASEIVELFLS